MSCQYAQCDSCAFRDDHPQVCDDCVDADQFEPMHDCHEAVEPLEFA